MCATFGRLLLTRITTSRLHHRHRGRGKLNKQTASQLTQTCSYGISDGIESADSSSQDSSSLREKFCNEVEIEVPHVADAPSSVWLCYDERMLLHVPSRSHPENPARITSVRLIRVKCFLKHFIKIFWHLNAAPLFPATMLDAKLINSLKLIKARPASDEELLLVHTQEHIDRLRSICAGTSVRDFAIDTLVLNNTLYR